MAENTQTVLVKLTLEGVEIEGAVELPAGPAPYRVLLPVLRQLTDNVVSIAEQRVHEAGQTVSCQKGCDACCRQMVPISAAEAHGLAVLLDSMPPSVAAEVLERFDTAVELLDQKGVLWRLKQRQTLSGEELQQLDRDYFAAQVACPFLEDKSCSIHAHRPLACREFLVTSPAIYCGNPTADLVQQVELPAKLSRALGEVEAEPWLPLVLARQFVADHPERSVTESPAQVLHALLGRL